MKNHLYLYYFNDPKHEKIVLIPEEKLQFRCIGTRDLEGMLITENPIPEIELEFPVSKMREVEKDYKGKFRPFKRSEYNYP